VRLHEAAPGQDPRLGDTRDPADRLPGARALRRRQTLETPPNVDGEEWRPVWIELAPLAGDARAEGHQRFEGVGRHVAVSAPLSVLARKRRDRHFSVEKAQSARLRYR
jgi:hypothetical protein